VSGMLRSCTVIVLIEPFAFSSLVTPRRPSNGREEFESIASASAREYSAGSGSDEINCGAAEMRRHRQRKVLRSCGGLLTVLSRCFANPGKVDETAHDVGVQELDTDMVANVETLETTHHFPFRRWVKDADPSAFLGSAGHNRVEASANARGQ